MRINVLAIDRYLKDDGFWKLKPIDRLLKIFNNETSLNIDESLKLSKVKPIERLEYLYYKNKLKDESIKLALYPLTFTFYLIVSFICLIFILLFISYNNWFEISQVFVIYFLKSLFIKERLFILLVLYLTVLFISVINYNSSKKELNKRFNFVSHGFIHFSY